MQTTTITANETLKLNRYTVTVTYKAQGTTRRETQMKLAAVNSSDAVQYGYRMLDQSIRSTCQITVTVHNASKVWICDAHFQPTVQAH